MLHGSISTKRYTAENIGRGPTLYQSARDYRFSRKHGYFVHKTFEPRPDGMTIVSLSSSGHAGTYVEGERPVLSLPQAGRVEVELNDRRLDIRAGEMTIINPCQRRSRMIRDDVTGTYDSYLVLLPKTWTRRLPMLQKFSAPDPMRAHLSALLNFAISTLSMPERVSDRTALLFEALIEDALSNILTAGDRTLASRRSTAVAREALAYVEARHSEPLSLARVADAVGVDARSLQRALKAETGQTFRTHLGLARLNAMRRSLEDCNGTMSVTSAAMDAGLFHLGRASRAYSARFLESPSETLRRAQKNGDLKE